MSEHNDIPILKLNVKNPDPQKVLQDEGGWQRCPHNGEMSSV